MNNDMKETCMIFVDDSNVWIEAQKFAASGKSRLPKLEDCDQDPRYRVNISKLVSTISRGRLVKGSFLYGSRPPPNDAVWNSYKEFDFNVNVYNRANNGKEKQVDNSMATDISCEATKLHIGAIYNEEIKQQLDNMTFIVISGDRDMLPPIIATLKCGIPVEVWAWESGISYEHKKMEGGNLQVYYLDQIADQIFFTNTRSTRTGKIVEGGKTIVLCYPNDKDNSMNFLEDSVSSCLLGTCHTLFSITQSQTGMELFVEFPNLKNVEGMILKVRDLLKDDWTVESWPEFASRLKKETLVTREKGTMFSPWVENNSKRNSPLATKQAKTVDVQAKTWSGWDRPKPLIEQGGNEDIDSEALDNWETARSRKDPKRVHRRAMQQTQACPYGLRSRKAAACGNYHTDEEKKLFRDFPNQNFTKWKTSRCRNYPYCPRGTQCAFAHSDAEAWCSTCHKQGHYKDACRFGNLERYETRGWSP